MHENAMRLHRGRGFVSLTWEHRCQSMNALFICWFYPYERQIGRGLRGDFFPAVHWLLADQNLYISEPYSSSLSSHVCTVTAEDKGPWVDVINKPFRTLTLISRL